MKNSIKSSDKNNFNHKKKEIIYLSRDKLKSLEGNPRKIIDFDAKEKLTAQIKKHDFQNPLNVYKEKNGTYTILCGNHRFEAGKEIMTEFPCIVYEGTKKEALARAIADNKTSEWTTFDLPQLKNMLTDLDDGEFDMGKTAFDENQLNALFAEKGDNDIAAEWEGMPEFFQEDKTAYRSIIVHFPDQNAVDMFSTIVKDTITDKTKFIWYPETVIEKYSDKRYINES